MVALFRGAEDAHFSPIGGPTVSTSTNDFDSNFARCAIFSNDGGINFGPSWWRIPSSFGISVTGGFWFTTRFRHANNFTIGKAWLSFNSAGDIARVQLWTGLNGGPSSTILSAYKVDSGGTYTFLGTGTAPIASGASDILGPLSKLDVNIVYSVGGSITVYGDGDLLMSLSGIDLTTDGVTTLTGIDLLGGGSTMRSEIIWDTADTRAWRLTTQAPQANGNTTQWSGSASDVNEIVLNDGNQITTPNPAQLEQFTVNQLPAGNWAVIDNTVWSRAMAFSPADPQHLQRNVRTHSNDYFSTSDTLSNSFVNNFTTWPLNPATGLAWTQAELDDPTYNIGVESIA